MDRPTRLTYSLRGVVALGMLGMLLVVSGCDSTPGDQYQTFSPLDAQRLEQARATRANRAAVASEVAEAGAPTAVVLAAARTAARAARPSGESDRVEQASRASTGPDNASVANASSAARSVEFSTSLAKIAGARAATVVAGEPVVRSIKLLVPEQTFTVEGPGNALRVSYDDFDLLKVLNMEPVPTDAVDHFPDWLAGLDGQRVRVRGFMYPTFQETDIPAFVLARDNQICCFGRNPKIYDLVEVTLADGVTTDYIQGRPFDVVGTFHIRPEADGDELWQLYQIDNAMVIDH